jgi:hypothetical protein
MEKLKAPFVYAGGKSTVAHVVWERFGNVPVYVEPFFGSGAVLLSRPHEPGTETVNDIDSMICNFYRAVKHDPDAVAHHADWPAIENCLHARHLWLLGQKVSLQERLEGDPEYYDAKVAGWWVWGMALWIGGEFCSGKGPWASVNGRMVRTDTGQGVSRGLIHLGDAGRGVQRRLIHLGGTGRGVQRKLIQADLYDWMRALSERFRRVRVTCGDWSRICGPSPTYKTGICGVFLDPPYGALATRDTVYTHDSHTVANDVRAWALTHGSNPLMRIALCGYVGEHEALQSHGWDAYYWKAHGGYGNQSQGRGRDNAKREVIWFSPHCLSTNQMKLF